MTREQCLDTAKAAVIGARQDSYGGPEKNFGRIARLWTAYLKDHEPSIELDETDVAAMMILLKVARILGDDGHMDSWVDIAGYAACGADIASLKRG